jgi:hypothetical protein
MAKPRKVNIGILQALRDVKTDETKQSAQDEQRRESGVSEGYSGARASIRITELLL